MNMETYRPEHSASKEIGGIEDANSLARLRSLRSGFSSKLKPSELRTSIFDEATQRRLSQIIGIEQSAMSNLAPAIMESLDQMFHGTELEGLKTLGLNEISSWKVNPEYWKQNLRQQSGYAAEVISTMKENLIEQTKETGNRIVRADDLPMLFQRNDQYVDKVMLDANGNVLERIQVKFVGKNPKEWLAKAMSKGWDKYYDGHVDKIECPKEYYEEIRAGIVERRANLERQLEHVTASGKTDAITTIAAKLAKLDILEQMLKQSTVSKNEALFARISPKLYSAGMFMRETANACKTEGLESGLVAAGITFTVSIVEDISSCIDGTMTPQDLVVDVTKDTFAAGVVGYGSVFVSTAVSQLMSKSSTALIANIGTSNAPAAVVSFAVESYKDVADFAQGKIDGGELAYNLGDHAAGIAGSVAGTAAAGAAAGTILGPAGTTVGALVGGIVGCALASEVYVTAVKAGAESAPILAERAGDFARNAIDAIDGQATTRIEDARCAFNEYFAAHNVPVSV